MSIPILGDLIGGVKDILSEVVVDKDKKMAIDLDLKKLEDQAQARLDAQVTGQIDVNKVEATNSNMFIAGWRPFVGWVGGVGLGMQAIVLPLVTQYTGKVYPINTELLIMVLGSMLGLGGMRTLEKIQGVASNGYEVQPQPSVTKTSQDSQSSVEVDTKKGTVSVETTPSPTPVPFPQKKKWKL